MRSTRLRKPITVSTFETALESYPRHPFAQARGKVIFVFSSTDVCHRYKDTLSPVVKDHAANDVVIGILVLLKSKTRLLGFSSGSDLLLQWRSQMIPPVPGGQ